MKFTFHWLLCTFSRLYTIIIINQHSMAMRCLNIFDVWLYYTFPGWWNAFESPMYQFFLKNRRNVVESSNVPFTVMVQSGSLLQSSELVGYAEDQQHGSFHADAVDGSMWLWPCIWFIKRRSGRRLWDDILWPWKLPRFFDVSIGAWFWVSHFNPSWGRQRQMGAARACLDLELAISIESFLSNYAYTWNLKNDGFQ